MSDGEQIVRGARTLYVADGRALRPRSRGRRDVRSQTRIGRAPAHAL